MLGGSITLGLSISICSLGLWHGRVEEWRDDGRERRGHEDVVVRRGGQNRELSLRAPGAVPTTITLAAAKQPEELHDVRGANGVGIPGDDQRGGLDGCHVLGPVILPPEQVTELGEQHRPILRPRRDGGIELIHRRLFHWLGSLRTHLRHSGEDLGLPPIPLERGRDDHELAYHLRVPDGGLQGDAATQGVTHDVGPLDTEMLDQCSDIVRH